MCLKKKDKSNDNIAFNGINLNESNNASDDEDDDNYGIFE
jgi:hypothetical protein